MIKVLSSTKTIGRRFNVAQRVPGQIVWEGTSHSKMEMRGEMSYITAMFKILCVEDSSDTIAILATTLEEHQVIFGKSVAEAQRFLQEDRFDLLLLDVDLPDGNGLEILATIQNKIHDMGVICLTGKQDFGSKVSAFSLGADDFVQKPFNPLELKLRVDGKLRKINKAKDAQETIR